MISHNIANVDTPGFKRHENHNYEINFSGPDNKPYLPGGVGTTISTNDYPWLDKRFNDALGAKAYADALKEGADAVGRVVNDDTLEKAFSEFMNATHAFMQNPNDSVYQERFNQTGAAFVERLNAVDSMFKSAESEIQEKIDLNNIKLETLQSQLQGLTTQPNTADVVADINFIKQQISQVTGSIAGYNKVLQKIIPPVTGLYNSAKQEVIEGSNTSYNREIISSDPLNGYSWNNDLSGDIQSLVEFGNQQFNKDMGRIKTLTGSLQLAADNEAGFRANSLNSAEAEFNAAYGVDLVEQSIKLKEYQRIYEANAKVIETADNMLGTLLDIFN